MTPESAHEFGHRTAREYLILAEPERATETVGDIVRNIEDCLDLAHGVRPQKAEVAVALRGSAAFFRELAAEAEARAAAIEATR
jgi:hypothetical protein